MPANKFLLAAGFWLVATLTAQAACRTIETKGLHYSACDFAPGTGSVETFNLNRNGEPFGYLSALAAEVSQSGRRLVFAMNAGMFDDNQLPIGLYVEDGQQTKKLNRRAGAGNFHLKPNGVFYVKNGRPYVQDTEAFAKSGVKPDFATQSGPMLVINGQIHPKFSANGTSRKLRNGVGVDDDGLVTFVISDSAVTFHEFASLFKDELMAKNALFFDGSVSSLFAPELGRNDGFVPLGPMVGVMEKH